MAVAQAAARSPRRAPPRPGGAAAPALVLAVAVGMVVAFFGWKSQVAVAGGATWNALAHHLDNFQTWLSDQRNVPAPERLLPRLQRHRDLPRQHRRLADVAVLQAHLGRNDRARRARRAALRRTACRPRRARGVRLVRGDGPVGAEHAHVCAHVRVGRALARDRDAARHPRRPLGPFPAR